MPDMRKFSSKHSFLFKESNLHITHIKFSESAMNSYAFLDKKDLVGLGNGATGSPAGCLIRRSVIVFMSGLGSCYDIQ